jgi:hypothetical protein
VKLFIAQTSALLKSKVVFWKASGRSFLPIWYKTLMQGIYALHSKANRFDLNFPNLKAKKIETLASYRQLKGQILNSRIKDLMLSHY